MLKLTVTLKEGLDEVTNTFVPLETVSVELEHSLVALSKWESEYEKPFLSKEAKTSEELLRYVQLMIVTPDVPEDIVLRLSSEDIEAVSSYISMKNSATSLPEERGAPSRETVTAELIYYWMIALNIPVAFETWNLNRLFTLIQVCNRKDSPPKKLSKDDVRRRMELNEQRLQALQTSG